MKLSAASDTQCKETHKISRNESDKCLLLPVASCTAVRRDFLEMTLCVFDSCIRITVYVWCIYVMHYDSYHRAQIYERKW